MSSRSQTLAERVQARAAALAGQPIVWGVFIAAMFAWPIVRALRAERDLARSRPVLGNVRPFALQDQTGSGFGTTELHGRPWVASFTATDCATACDRAEHVLGTLAELRHRTRQLGENIRLVTFPVDPERATAARMDALAAAHRASRGPWRFVYGPPARIRDVLRDFGVAAGTLQTRVALVDGQQRIRGYYDLAEPAAIPLLLRDVSLLLAGGGV